ncbi:MAG: amidohydrolase family protein [Acetobacteraceae bacterium]|nr:amidohydrolase family protein [Acetobacteraceae bacterium]
MTAAPTGSPQARADAYDGPVIDAHHHFWDLSTERYPWLTGRAAIGALGDVDDLRRDYLPDDYALDIAGQGVVASVHVEALWDRSRSPVEETAWLAALPRPLGIAARCVVAAPLTRPDLPRLLEEHAAFPIVAGIRETIRWHPDPAKRWTAPGLVDDPAWRAGVARLAPFGWVLELLMNPHQALEVAGLARAMPGQIIVVNHCCTPNDRDPEGMARWRDGLTAMGREVNILIKVSNYAAYTPERSFEADRDTLRTCIDAFGPARCMFGSDYPVARRTMTYADLMRRFRAVVAEYSPAEQRDLFHDTAARTYGFAA